MMKFSRNQLTEKQLKVFTFIEREIQKRGRSPTYREIARFLGVNAIGTIQDHVAKLVDFGLLEKEKGQTQGLKLPIQNHITWIPILGSVPAGKPIEAVHDFKGSLPLSGRWQGDFFALQIKGESMKDRGILDGDYVIVKKQSDAENGQIIVAMIESEATVKLLEKKRGQIRLIPANPLFKPIELRSDEENIIVGRVVAVQRVFSH